jgi:IS30 family transposase
LSSLPAHYVGRKTLTHRGSTNRGQAKIRSTVSPTVPAGDQGNELFHHQRIEQATGIRIYFADPHSPWQRGTNENTNGLLRQYFPKGTNLDLVSDERLRFVADEINDRPRIVLDDRAPAEIMARWIPRQVIV